MAKKIIRSDERKSIFGLDVNGPVFFTSTIIIIISITLTLIFEKQAEVYFSHQTLVLMSSPPMDSTALR